jgi:predicted secreted protein
MEYGVQDGSGFPYASIFIIDLRRDAFATRPVRIVIDKEMLDVRVAMRQALQEAGAALKKLKIEPLLTGRELFHASATEGMSAAIRAQFVLWPFQLGNPKFTHTLQLSTFPLPGGDCPLNTVESARGFALDAVDMNTGSGLRLYEDRRVPKSRHCAIAYAIDRVIHFRPRNGEARTVVILRYGYYSFEGLDERYLAVPVQLPALGGK